MSAVPVATGVNQARIGVGSRFEAGIAAAAFLLLFPGYLFYHFAVANGLIPSFLGGYFGIASLMLLPFLLLPLVLRALGPGLGTFEWCVMLLLLYFASWAGLHFFVGAEYQRGLSRLSSSIAFITLIAVLFIAARFLRIRSLPPMSAYSLLYVAMAIVVLANVGPDLVIQVIVSAIGNTTEVSTYQGLARSVLVFAALVLAASGSVFALVSIGVTLTVLLFIGARSEFAGFAIMVVALAPVWFRTRPGAFVGLLAAGLAAIGVLVYVGLAMEGFRILELLDLERSSSFQGRQEMARAAWQTIESSPLLGDYASETIGYAHNALSAWVSFGLGGFLLYAGLVVWAFAGSAIRVLSAPASASSLLIASYCFNVYSLVMIIAAKHVSDPVIAIGWGLYAAVLAIERRSAPRENA